MTKEQLCKEIVRRTKLPIADVELVVEHFQRSVAAALGAGDNVVMQGFGRFHVVRRAPRTIMGIHGKPVQLPAQYRPQFRPHTELLQFLHHKLNTRQ